MTSVLVTGHRGLLGQALVPVFAAQGYDVLTVDRADLDLTDRGAVRAWLERHQPDVVILGAAKVGGIAANIAEPVEFLVENLRIQDAVMTGSAAAGVKVLVFIGSSCMYPRETAQPMREDQLWTGPVEPTNASYAVAKLAGLQLGQALAAQHDLRVVIPVLCNLYGPGDHFDPTRSHVVPALVKRFADARREGVDEVVLWGTGRARRELLHATDAAEAIALLLRFDVSPEPVNIGPGTDVSIVELAETVREVVGFTGRVGFDGVGPDGMPQKVMNVTRAAELGWRARIALTDGLADVLADYHRRTA